jgi:hypothetical protein
MIGYKIRGLLREEMKVQIELSILKKIKINIMRPFHRILVSIL